MANTMSMSIITEIYHLQELPRYMSEKPYTMRYVPEGGTAVSNVLREKRKLLVKDIRGSKHEYTLDRNGFMISQLPTSLDYATFDSQEAIENEYFPELETILLDLFPESTVDFVSYLIRKREASFPYSTGQQYSHGQPNIVAHIDATPDDLVRQVKRRHGLDAKDFIDGRIQYITIWKPLRGPLHDYPLALCDKQSVDEEKDFEPQDIVDRDEVLENVHVYHRKRHAWCYLGGQEDTELLIFRQADTLQKGFGTPHCAISNPAAPPDGFPRESIEVVAFIYTKF